MMSDLLEDEFLKDCEVEGLVESSLHGNNNQESLNVQDEEDVTISEVGASEDPLNNNIDEENQENISAPVQVEVTSKRQQKSKAQKKEEKKLLKEEKTLKFRKALDELREGKWKSIAGCAKAHGLSDRTLQHLYKTGQDYRGAGKTLTVFTEDEEMKIATYIRHQCKFGFGLSYFELQRTIQELAEGLSAANPHRKFPEAWAKFLPEKWFVYNFAKRHLLTLRSTMELNKARSIITREDLELWQSDTEHGLVFHPDTAGCWKDPRRIFNQVK